MGEATEVPGGGGAPLPGGFLPLEQGDPASVGPFRLVGRIGAGGMGAVYGALGKDGAHVAVKVVHPEFATDPAYREQFAQEAELLARVDALCAPEFHGADPAADQPWLATEFVAGRTLKEHVAEVGVLGQDALLSFAAGTAEALSAVHAAGVLHRDVKPANIMLSPSGPRVLDFGIARAEEDDRAEGATFGTPGWAAPERLAGAPATARSDVFAWGGLVVYAATGRGPFGRGTGAELVRRSRTEDPDLSGVPEELQPVVRAALDRDPEVRPDAAGAMQAVLDLVPGTEADVRTRLRALFERTWHGFTAAGRGAGPWVAATVLASGSKSVVGAVGTGGSSSAGTGAGGAAGALPTGTKMAGGTLFGGVNTATAIGVGAVLLVAVATGGWVGGRVLADEPVVPVLEQAEEDEEDGENEQGEEGGQGEDEDTQEVEFGALTVDVPAEWTVQRYERTYQPFDAPDPTEGETVVLGTDPDAECEEGQGNVAFFSCPKVVLHGPAGIGVGSYAEPMEATTPFIPAREPESCDQPLETTPAPPPEEGSGTSTEPEEAQTITIDGVQAEYREWVKACHDNDTQEPISTEGPLVNYEQRYWFLQDVGVLVVDDHETAGLDAILEQARIDA